MGVAAVAVIAVVAIVDVAIVAVVLVVAVLVAVEACCLLTLITQVVQCFLLQVFVHRDFSAVRDEAMKMIQTAFTLLDQEFQKLDRYMYMFVCLCLVCCTYSMYIRP